MITCSIHATEVASTHTAVEFAYRLLTEDTNPKFKAILDNVIILLEPSQNPDGVDIVTRWYRKTRGTPFDGTSPPELYHHYVGHDDNRDWYIFTQPETRNTATLENKWHPEIVYDVHQMGPNTARIFVPPWMDPVDPNIDPILASICNMIGTGMATDLAAAGKTGIAINAMYDFWSPGRQYQAYHGGARILTESASVKLATPITHHAGRDHRATRSATIRASGAGIIWIPWMGGHVASARHHRLSVDRMGVAALSGGDAARRTCCSIFTTSTSTTSSGRRRNAFVIPAAQRDPGAAKKMLETLAFGDTEIERASAGFHGGRKSSIAAGSYVISMHQPFSGWAKTLLERQDYPDLRALSRRSSEAPVRRDGADAADADGRRRGHGEGFVPRHAEAGDAIRFRAGSPEPAGAMAATDVDSWKEVAKIWKSRQAGLSRRIAPAISTPPPANGRKEIEGAAHRHVSKLRSEHGRRLDALAVRRFRIRAHHVCTTPTCRPAICARASTRS